MLNILNKKGLILFLGLLLLAAIVGAGCAESKKNLTLEQRIEKEIVRAIGKTRQKQFPNRVLNIHIDDLEGYEKAFILMVADKASSEKTIKDKIYLNSIKLYPLLFAKFEELEGIHIEWQVPNVDGEELQSVLYMSLRREQADNINWDAFQSDEFRTKCEYYHEDPALQ